MTLLVYDIDYKVGDYFSGVLLETIIDDGISRPRVKTIDMFSEDMRVEFPRKLREVHPIGSRFRALLKVCHKTNKATGELRGDPYLRADKKTITLQEDYSPIDQIYAIPKNDRTYEYDYFCPTVEELNKSIKELREKAYENAIENPVRLRTIAAGTITNERSTSKAVRSYAIQRSEGICESCEKEAPFITKNGNPYLEIHHLIPISKGGKDHPENVAAICPNCHSQTEHGEDAIEFNDRIINKISLKEEKLAKL